LRPFITESEKFDQAFAETFALPEFTLMKGEAMRAASRMLSILASYSDFPEEIATKMIADDLLLTDLQDKKTTEEFHKAIDSALTKEITSLTGETKRSQGRFLVACYGAQGSGGTVTPPNPERLTPFELSVTCVLRPMPSRGSWFLVLNFR
jgi:hypothetical protein